MRGRTRGWAVFGVVLAVVGSSACGPSDRRSDVPQYTDRAALDAEEVDVVVPVPTSCPGRGVVAPIVTGVDRATSCPTSIRVDYPYSGPGVCDEVRACCSFPRACVFNAQFVLYINGPCGGRERLPPKMGFASGCTCVEGQVSCRTYPGAIANACLDCFIGSARDGGLDVPMGPDVPLGPDVPMGPDD